MDNEYITVEEAAEILQVTTRGANRYGHGPNPRLRSRKAGRRLLYNKADVIELARDLGVLNQPRPTRPKTDLVPAGDMLNYIRERDNRLDALQQALNQAMLEIGRLQARLEQHKLLADENNELRNRLAETEARIIQLESELEKYQ